MILDTIPSRRGRAALEEGLTGPGRVFPGWEREEGESPVGKNVGETAGVRRSTLRLAGKAGQRMGGNGKSDGHGTKERGVRENHCRWRLILQGWKGKMPSLFMAQRHYKQRAVVFGGARVARNL